MVFEEEMRRKKIDPPNIKTLDKRIQVARAAYAFYDMNVGTIDLGCEEKHVANAIWHETIHMLFFEQYFLEANYMWDNIANELQEYLFSDGSIPEAPYIFTLPPIKAKPEDDGWYIGRKRKNSIIKKGFKPDLIGMRVPIHVNRG